MSTSAIVAIHETGHILGDALFGATSASVTRDTEFTFCTKTNVYESPEFLRAGKQAGLIIAAGLASGAVAEHVHRYRRLPADRIPGTLGKIWMGDSFWTPTAIHDQRSISLFLESGISRAQLLPYIERMAETMAPAITSDAHDWAALGAKLDALPIGKSLSLDLAQFLPPPVPNEPWSSRAWLES